MDETRNDAPLTGEAPQPAKPQPLRRVGSFTLGVCLIAAGIFFLLAYFVPPARAAGNTISGRC